MRFKMLIDISLVFLAKINTIIYEVISKIPCGNIPVIANFNPTTKPLSYTTDPTN